MELDYEKKKIGHYIEISKNMNKADPQEEIVVNKKTNKVPRMEFVHRRDCRKE